MMGSYISISIAKSPKAQYYQNYYIFIGQRSYADIDKALILAWGSSKDVFKICINIMAHCPGSFQLGMKAVSQDLSSKLRTLDGSVHPSL